MNLHIFAALFGIDAGLFEILIVHQKSFASFEASMLYDHWVDVEGCMVPASAGVSCSLAWAVLLVG